MSNVVLNAVALIAGLFSWAAAQRLGAFLGLVWFYIVRIRRAVVFENLAIALPGTRSEHYRVARDAYRHFGVSALEFFKMSSLSPSEISKKVHAHGMEHFERAYSRGRGVIVVAAHYGNFDLLACSQAARGIPLAIVSRDLHSKGTNGFWMRTRRSSGLTVFQEKGAAREVIRWLRQGKVLGLTVDQRTPPKRGGMLAGFLGWNVWTTTAPAKLALRLGAALVPVRVERREDGDHDLVVEPEIELPDNKKDEGIILLTKRINDVVANWVLTRPEHWMWLHRRFSGAKRTTT